ncbi:endonuclease domain-containing 1 protein-like [Colossoma macropomum]|uniref:endonuclease domain-containing 1 protein-like n=1 Tax=Colossoma macropomum TaxID=42526 RepID=UPI001864F9CB|nr:endonuclease domain-containing 1 protein-like [Colossoma macropomum]XP_036417290.1 endonuclease domain-containing 1 protein-like [Colossoma macropomum]XP_036417291.1 endonuclease domain-containing 1 protein-like [Colossoma macropomum]
MMKCLLILLRISLILLLAFSSLASCRLVANFLAAPPNGCPQFFLNTPNGRVTPTILQGPNQRYRQICQEHLGVDRFATLYDTQSRIPVYSAYLHVHHAQVVRNDQWRQELGLTNDQQATNNDYANSGMQKGHLYPVYHNDNNVQADATFTLTNAAPQAQAFNNQWFHQVEQPINQHIENNCRGNPAYIVTGVIPSQNTINNRVRVASHFWTAYCCRDNNGHVASGGALAWWNGALQLTPYGNAQIQLLEQQLTNLYNIPFQVFGGHC